MLGECYVDIDFGVTVNENAKKIVKIVNRKMVRGAHKVYDYLKGLVDKKVIYGFIIMFEVKEGYYKIKYPDESIKDFTKLPI